MREIKFRAWDKVYKHFHEGDLVRDYVIGEFIDNPEYEVTQYTGLKDKNGKEIYEGDIVNRYANAFGEIGTFITGEIKMYECAWWIDRECETAPLWGEMIELEVIGNIYENPNLIK